MFMSPASCVSTTRNENRTLRRTCMSTSVFTDRSELYLFLLLYDLLNCQVRRIVHEVGFRHLCLLVFASSVKKIR